MPEASAQETPPAEIRHFALDEFDVFINQAREHFDQEELKRLSDDIRARGLLQPGVAWLDPGRSRPVLICGERRLRACKMAGLPTMAVTVIRGKLSQGRMLALNLAENLQRASLSPIERAKGFQRLMQLENLNATEVASQMNVSNATVSNALALLDLPETLQAKIASGVLPASVGCLLARLGDNHGEARRELADQYEGGRINRSGIAKQVNSLLHPDRKGKGGKKRRLSAKLAGLAISVSGTTDKFTYDNLAAVLSRIGKEAKSLTDAGTFNAAALAAALKT